MQGMVVVGHAAGRGRCCNTNSLQHESNLLKDGVEGDLAQALGYHGHIGRQFAGTSLLEEEADTLLARICFLEHAGGYDR